jgi:hypothetical protein
MTKEELDALGLETVPKSPLEKEQRIYPVIRETVKGMFGRAPGQLISGIGMAAQYGSHMNETPVYEEAIAPHSLNPVFRNLPMPKTAPPEELAARAHGEELYRKYRAPVEKAINVGMRKTGEVLRGAGEEAQKYWAASPEYAVQHPAMNWAQQEVEGAAATLAPSWVPYIGPGLTALIAAGKQGQTSYETAKLRHPEWTDEQALEASMLPATVTGAGFALFPAASRFGKGVAKEAFKKAAEDVAVQDIVAPSLAQRMGQWFAGGAADTLLMQTQNAGVVGAEKYTGARPEANVWKEVITNPAAWGSAFVLSSVFQSMDALKQARTIRSLKMVLNHPEADIHTRAVAAAQIGAALGEAHPDLANAWDNYAAEAIMNRQPIPFDAGALKTSVLKEMADTLEGTRKQTEANYETTMKEGRKQAMANAIAKATGTAPDTWLARLTPSETEGLYKLPSQKEMDMQVALREGVPISREELFETAQRSREGDFLANIIGAQRGVNRENPFIREGLGLEEPNAVNTREGIVQTEHPRTVENVQGEGAYRNEPTPTEKAGVETGTGNIVPEGKTGEIKSIAPRIIAYENGIMPESERIPFYQDMVDSGEAAKQGGHYARTALDLVKLGVVKADKAQLSALEKSQDTSPLGRLFLDGPESIDFDITTWQEGKAYEEKTTEKLSLSELAAPERSRMVEALGRAIEKKYGIAEGELGFKESKRPVEAGLDKLAALAGKRIVVVDANPNSKYAFRAFYPGSGDYIFLNSRATRPQLSLYGHELMHSMKKNAPDIYRRFADAVETQNLGDLEKLYKNAYKNRPDFNEMIKEEAIANYVAERMPDPKFWQKIMAKDPNLAARVATFAKDFLALISRNKATMEDWAKGKFKDLQAVEEAATTALAEYHRLYGAEQAGAKNMPQAKAALKQWTAKGTNSPFFRKWFGDSKVTNEDGSPMVVYHGTNSQIAKFSPMLVNLSKNMGGFWFTNNADIAQRHGNNLMSVYLNIKNPMPAGEWWDSGKKVNSYAEFVHEVESRGYDGIEIASPDNPTKMYIALRPEQIKSVNNIGTFDPANPDIRFDLKEKTMTKLQQLAGQEDVSKAVDAFQTGMNGILLVVRPEAISKGAQLVADVHRSKQGIMNQKMAQAYVALDSAVPKEHLTGVAKLFDLVQQSGRISADAIFAKMTTEEADNFRQWMDTGIPPRGFEPSETLQKIGGVSAGLLRDVAERIQGLGIGYLDYLREFVWPHIYEKPTETQMNQVYATISKRRAEGSKQHGYERIFDDIFAAREAGMKSLFDNPMDELFAKLTDMERFLLTHDTAQTVYQMDSDLIFPVRMSDPTPADHSDLTNRFSKGFVLQHISPDGRPLVDEAGHNLDEIRYRWVMRNDVAPIFNNYLARGLYGNQYIGKPFEMYMRCANSMNMFQLGVGSGFHAGFTSFEAMISHQALGVQMISEKRFAEGAKYFLEAPKMIWQNPMIGNALYNLWRGKGPESKWMGELLKYGINDREAKGALEMMRLGAFRAGMDTRFMTNHTQHTLQNWANGHKIKAALHSIPAFVEQTARPIMEALVPRQKIGVFAEEAFKFMRDNPKATHEEMLREANDIMDRVDSRLGQVNYDRLFVQPVFKNITQAMLRAPGWTGGTIFEVGGGMVDIAKWIKDGATGNYKPLSRRASYTMSLMMTTAIINSLLTYMWTGESPTIKDMFAFRTGEKDELGREQRFMLPTYMKDVHAWYTQTEKTATNKLNPFIGLLNELRTNKDYYGTEIIPPDEPIYVRTVDGGVFIAKQFIPFWMRGIQKEAQRKSQKPISYIGPLFGIMPAPSDFYMSEAERHMYEVMAASRGESKQTREEFQRKQIIGQIVIERRRGEDSGLLASAKAEGILRPRDIKEINEKAKGLPFVRNFTHLRFQDAAVVYQLATPEERDLIQKVFIHKLNTFKKNGSPNEIQDMTEKYPEWRW